MAARANAFPPGFEKTRAWQDFYKFKENFADVSYAYAITAHKSQGSTYRYVFAIESDMDANSKIEEMNRIKYTAFTRPSHRLFIVQ
jgi:exodeoxyribonuclease-5